MMPDFRRGSFILSAILLLAPASSQKAASVASDPRQHLAQLLLAQLLEQRQVSRQSPADHQHSASTRVDASPLRPRSVGVESVAEQQIVQTEPATNNNNNNSKRSDTLETLLRKRANVEERRSKLKSSPTLKTVVSRLDASDDDEVPVNRRRDVTCENCVDGTESNLKARWTMPLNDMGHKKYYLGIFFKSNWYKANQFCRYHGMHLASIASEEENKHLETLINSQGLGLEHFWTSGTDQGEEGTFFWLSTGRPVTYTNWNAGEPNNFVYENGEEEHCLELWNRDGKGLKWNDTPCSFETFFICEVTA